MNRIKRLFKGRGKATADKKEAAKELQAKSTPSYLNTSSVQPVPEYRSVEGFRNTTSAKDSGVSLGNGNKKVESLQPNYSSDLGKKAPPKFDNVHDEKLASKQRNKNGIPGPQVLPVQSGGGNSQIIDPTTCHENPKPSPVSAPTTAQGRPVSIKSTGGWSYSGGSMGGGSMGGHSCGGGGCFLGTNTVQMADGSTSSVQDIVKGDKVACNKRGDETGVVACVLATRIPSGWARMVTFPDSGLCITPGHPILVDGSWVKPKDVRAISLTKCDYYYSFLLEDGGTSVIINGVICVTLGHGVKGDVRKHELWGDLQNVTRMMRTVDDVGFSKGRVEIAEDRHEISKGRVSMR